MGETLTTIRFAKESDFSACVKFDHPVDSRSVLRTKIGAKEIVLAFEEKECVGYLRLEYLWSLIPYIGLIRVKEELRGRGIGTQILQFLEAYLRKKGYRLLLSSSMVNEARPQHWHRKMGFEECGVITGLSEEGVGEIFFRKRLGP